MKQLTAAFFVILNGAAISVSSSIATQLAFKTMPVGLVYDGKFMRANYHVPGRGAPDSEKYPPAIRQSIAHLTAAFSGAVPEMALPLIKEGDAVGILQMESTVYLHVREAEFPHGAQAPFVLKYHNGKVVQHIAASELPSERDIFDSQDKAVTGEDAFNVLEKISK